MITTFRLDTTQVSRAGFFYSGQFHIDHDCYQACSSDTPFDMADALADKLDIAEDEEELMDELEDYCLEMIASQAVFDVVLTAAGDLSYAVAYDS